MSEKAYSKSFASIYDEVMDNVPYGLWYNYIIDLLDFYNKKPKDVIELACGTANMTLRFAKNHNWNLAGVDLSEDMLKIAENKSKNKNLNIKFYNNDIRYFSPDKKYDFAYSLFDSLNYILEYEELKKVFKNTFDLLKSDGYFIFDMNTIQRLLSINEGTMLLTGDNYSCFWQDIVDEENKIWKVKLKIYFDENKIDFKKEVHKETSYPIKDVIVALKWAGFKEIEVFNAYTFDKAKENNNRVYFIAGKKLLKKNNFMEKITKKTKWKILKLFAI